MPIGNPKCSSKIRGLFSLFSNTAPFALGSITVAIATQPVSAQTASKITSVAVPAAEVPHSYPYRSISDLRSTPVNLNVGLNDDDEEAIYPLTPTAPPGAAQTKPPIEAKKMLALPTIPPRVEYSNSGPASGNFGGDFHAERDVVVTITEVASGKDIKIFADVVNYNSKTGDISATGTAAKQIKLVAQEGVFTADSMQYNLIAKAGLIRNATVDGIDFRLHGELINANSDGSFTAENAMFTTCLFGNLDGKGRVPDYRISAGHMTVFPGRYVSAKRVMLYVGRQKTIPLPSIKRSLRTSSSVSSVPTPSYNRHDGLTMHFKGTPLSDRRTTYDYDVLANLSRLPTGYLLYQNDISNPGKLALPPKGILPSLGDPLNSILQQFNAPTYNAYVQGRPYEEYPDRVTFYGILGNQQYIYNRNVPNLTLSRLPEVGIHFGNILGKLSTQTSATPDKNIQMDRVPFAPALLEAYASFGFLHESPTGITSGRAYTRINFASQPQIIGRRLSWRYAATNWMNIYTRGTVYDLFAPEVEVDYVPTRTSLFDVGYRYLTDVGSTPFTSDRRDLRHEMRVQYQVGGPYVFGITAKFDMERIRAYDEEITLLRRLDCMQYGISYRVRSQSFQVIFELLPPGKSRDKEN